MGKDLKGRELGKGLYQRPDGRYEAKAMIKGIKINLYDTDLKQLKIALEKAKDELKEGIDSKFKDITVGEWFDYWFERYKLPALKASSVYPTKGRYKSTFGVMLDSLRLDQLRNVHIQEAVNELVKKGRAVSSIRSALGLFRACLDSAKNNSIIRVNPSFDIVVPWSENKQVLRRFLTVEERDLFLKEIENSLYKEMYYVMLGTGMRIGEVGGLSWSDVDFKNEVIHITKSLCCQYEGGVKTQKLTLPKTVNSVRDIPFMGEVGPMLQQWKEKQLKWKRELGPRWRAEGDLSNLVFTTSMGSPVTRYVVEKDMRNIVAQINAQRIYEGKKEIEHIYPHALRHTFCSMCFERDMNPKVVQQIMGHANYSTTMDIYTHVTNTHIEEDIKKFGGSVVRKSENPLRKNEIDEKEKDNEE